MRYSRATISRPSGNHRRAKGDGEPPGAIAQTEGGGGRGRKAGDSGGRQATEREEGERQAEEDGTRERARETEGTGAAPLGW